MSEKKKKKDGEVIDDPRFSKVHTDRRFMKVPNFKKETKSDPRFRALETDKRFGFAAEKDIYGRDEFTSSEEEEDLATLSRDEPFEEKRLEDEDFSDSDSSEDSSSEESSGIPEEEIEYGEETDRIAVVNCDFENLKAIDLLMIFNSFLPTDGFIKSVTIYPSDFGLKTMEEESRRGPNVWKEKLKGKDDNDDDGFDLKKLRTYEMNKLKYYFAVIECNSINTASKLYKALNDSEIENTANKLDLRFIPEHISFEGRQTKDTANSLPSNYNAPNFETKALQSTKPVFTWDQTPTERRSLTQKQFTKEQMREMDFQAYLADSSDSDDEERRLKYSALIGEMTGDEPENPDDMEIMFTEANDDDLDENVKEIIETEDGENMTVFDKYMEKQRRKKREKRAAKKDLKLEEENSSESEDNKPVKKRKRNKNRLEEKTEKPVDLSDDRLNKLITDPRFHIDPTHPRFKKTKTNDLILKEKQKFRKKNRK